ncbi:MAG: 2-isopropylmalate synthase [SAR202 cluster bacterium Casp-Chloro-G4]|nr:2-isopropylmalate synthase [Chloroflexota bacterium]MDA1226838.1 2-isopropylmalate synthase [Chloroflexota bacterium]PKB60881.1 MAG: 2-isopropylmalate synthase [SAR202 cluster bacterium Casp-Chloro-G4]
MPNDKVIIFDTTLRDGEQSAGIGLTTHEKMEIAKQLDRLGVDVIEAGFAASSPGDFEAVQAIAREVRRPIIASLARCVLPDVDAAWGAIKDAAHPRIHVFISSSDVQIMHQLRRNPEEVMEMAIAAVERAKSYCDDVEFSPMDATRTDMDFLYKMLEGVIAAGANTINIPDTVGYIYPWEFRERLRLIKENVSNFDQAVLSVHCHNDLGQAVSNSLAAVVEGARQVEGCINGLGERAGNAALEEVIMGLETRKDLYKVDTNIDTRQIYRTSRLVSDITGFAVQPNKAIVGANAFRHASGIHQDGILKERSTFEIMDPQSIGWPNNKLVLGKLSGRAGLRSRLEELGYNLEKEALNEAFEEFKLLADRKPEVTDTDLESLMSSQRRTVDVPSIYQLEHVQVSCGNREIPTATITIIDPDGRSITDAATGTGPVDAVYKAINRMVNVPNKLTEYRVDAVTEGIDALGDVTIRIEKDNKAYVGRGSDVDIIVASAKAYMNALNRLLATESTRPAAEVPTS